MVKKGSRETELSIVVSDGMIITIVTIVSASKVADLI